MDAKMNHKEIFYRESKKYQFPKTNIAQEISEPLFVEINRLFSSADGLSIKNGEKHRRVLLALSIVGTLLTFSFLIYDEIEIYGLILACGIMIVCLFVIRHFSVKLDCHRKYLQYRVLAETLRLQYYLSMAAIRMKVSDLLPWSIQMEIEWIKEVLETLPMAETKEKQSVLECWIKDQKSYHQQALKKAEKNNKRDKVIGKSVLFITILAYLIAIVFEFFVYKNNPSSMNINSVRVILKVVLGTMSAVTLFTSSYYGKMSLDNKIDDHRRMIALYQKSEQEIEINGETDELLLSLAREFLSENSNWYAYQKKNNPDLVI
jgi:hypothetical protein